MSIKVKLSGDFRVNGEKERTIDYIENITLEDIVDILGIRKNKQAIVIINGDAVSLQDFKKISIEDESIIHFLPYLTGG